MAENLQAAVDELFPGVFTILSDVDLKHIDESFKGKAKYRSYPVSTFPGVLQYTGIEDFDVVTNKRTIMIGETIARKIISQEKR